MRAAFAILCSCVLFALAAFVGSAQAGDYYDGYSRPRSSANVWYSSDCCYKKVVRHVQQVRYVRSEPVRHHGYYDAPRYRESYYAPPRDHYYQQPARYTDVYVWNGAAWRLVSVQNTPIKDAVAVRQQTGTTPAHAPWQGQDPAGDDLAVLRTLNENYVKAFREADVAWYDAHLAPDYAVASGDGSFHDRAAALTNFAKPSFAMHMKSFPVDNVNIRRFDDVALIHAENAYELKDGRKGVSRYTDIWHKQNGRWLCIAAHITVHKAPAL
jgi:ketosteroid isomerase-like protein